MLYMEIEDPNLERRRIENEKLRDEWTGCCSKTNKNYLKYMTQIAMGASVMVFSMVQIAIGADNPEIYFSLLSGTLAVFMPTPHLNAEH